MNRAAPRKGYILRWWRGRAQGLVEYALILAAVAILVIAIVTYIGNIVATNMYSKISSGIPNP